MSNIPSSAAYVQQEGVQAAAPVSEFLLDTMGGSNNDLQDKTTSQAASIASLNATAASLQSQITTAQNEINALNRLQYAALVSSNFPVSGGTSSYSPPAGHYAIVRVAIMSGGSGSFQLHQFNGFNGDITNYGTVPLFASNGDVTVFLFGSESLVFTGSVGMNVTGIEFRNITGP